MSDSCIFFSVSRLFLIEMGCVTSARLCVTAAMQIFAKAFSSDVTSQRLTAIRGPVSEIRRLRDTARRQTRPCHGEGQVTLLCAQSQPFGLAKLRGARLGFFLFLILG